MYVMGLHQSLLPPASIGLTTAENEESYARHLATESGLELLRINWERLLPLLLPIVELSSDAACPSSAPAVIDDTPAVDTTTRMRENPYATDGGAARQTRCIESGTELRQPVVRACDVRALRAPSAMDRIHYSYIVFLRFFGWRMHDDRRGVLDRHRGWAMRYQSLQRVAHAAPDTAIDAPAGGEARYGVFDFYASALPHMLRSLLDLGFFTYAIRLVEFLLEELACDRLTFLYPLVERTLVPLICEHSNSDGGVDDSHKRRLKRMLRRLTCSDSDD